MNVNRCITLYIRYIIYETCMMFNDEYLSLRAPLRTNETEIALDIRLPIRKVKKSCKIVKPNCVTQ
jgi:hypothetical protein